MVGHRGYIGGHFQTWIALEEIFGTDAMWNKPEPEAVPGEPKQVVN